MLKMSLNEARTVQCFHCGSFQMDLTQRENLWRCALCGIKQALRMVFVSGSELTCRDHIINLHTNSNTAKIDDTNIENHPDEKSPRVDLSMDISPDVEEPTNEDEFSQPPQSPRYFLKEIRVPRKSRSTRRTYLLPTMSAVMSNDPTKDTLEFDKIAIIDSSDDDLDDAEKQCLWGTINPNSYKELSVENPSTENTIVFDPENEFQYLSRAISPIPVDMDESYLSSFELHEQLVIQADLQSSAQYSRRRKHSEENPYHIEYGDAGSSPEKRIRRGPEISFDFLNDLLSRPMTGDLITNCDLISDLRTTIGPSTSLLDLSVSTTDYNMESMPGPSTSAPQSGRSPPPPWNKNFHSADSDYYDSD